MSMNIGLSDQVKCLDWIRDNIESFGGDRKKITVFGSGSGASSIGLLMLSMRAELPLAEGGQDGNNAFEGTHQSTIDCRHA